MMKYLGMILVKRKTVFPWILLSSNFKQIVYISQETMNTLDIDNTQQL